MANKTQKAEAMKKEITQAALDLFFEKGYETTSIRMIQNKVGKEVGLFYYYFKSKDEVFEAAMDLYFDKDNKEMQQMVQEGRDHPENELMRYINYMQRESERFREYFQNRLHWSLICAIREYTLRLMKQYIKEILENYVEKGLITEPERGLEVTANLLAFGIGGSIIYQSAEEFKEQKSQVCSLIELLTGRNEQ